MFVRMGAKFWNLAAAAHHGLLRCRAASWVKAIPTGFLPCTDFVLALMVFMCVSSEFVERPQIRGRGAGLREENGSKESEHSTKLVGIRFFDSAWLG